MRGLLLLGVWLLAVAAAPPAAAEDPPVPRYALAVKLGQSYTPVNDLDFVLLDGAVLYDYDQVWAHRAPEPLRFKVEAQAGLLTAPRTRAVLSANMLALYYLDGLATEGFRPYGEAGIGLIYTDFQVEEQGLRINFNPQAGLGVEIASVSGPPWFVGMRLQHLSNGDLHRDNRGINALFLQVGRFF